jgi:hypothetical protein
MLLQWGRRNDLFLHRATRGLPLHDASDDLGPVPRQRDAGELDQEFSAGARADAVVVLG